MFWKWILLFTLFPLVELALLIQLGQYIGVLPTILLVFVTGGIGASLARIQGLVVIRDFQITLRKAQVPAMSMIEGLLIILGAAFLVTPGLISDIVGFLLIIPASREIAALYVARFVTSAVKKKVHSQRDGRDYQMHIEWEEDES